MTQFESSITMLGDMISEAVTAPDNSVGLRIGPTRRSGLGRRCFSGWMRGWTATLLLVMLAGCASSGSTDVRIQLSPTVARMRSAVVRVTSTVDASEEAALMLEGTIVELLRQRGAFEKVYAGVAAPNRLVDLSVYVRVIRFSGVSPMARALPGAIAGPLGGAIAGQAVIIADVELQGKIGEVLGAAQIEGRSSAGSTFAGTTMQAVQRTAEQVADFTTRK